MGKMKNLQVTFEYTYLTVLDISYGFGELMNYITIFGALIESLMMLYHKEGE